MRIQWPRGDPFVIVQNQFVRIEGANAIITSDLCSFLQIKCEGIVVSGQPEVKVIEGLTNLHADAVIIGTHDRGSLSRYSLGFHLILKFRLHVYVMVVGCTGARIGYLFANSMHLIDLFLRY